MILCVSFCYVFSYVNLKQQSCVSCCSLNFCNNKLMPQEDDYDAGQNKQLSKLSVTEINTFYAERQKWIMM